MAKTTMHRSAPKLFGAKTKGDYASIRLPSGRKKAALFLGAGRFSNAFFGYIGNEVYLYTMYDDMSKDILVEAHKRLPRNPHIPSIRFLGTLPGPTWASWDIKVYKSRYYDTHTSKHEMTHSAWYDRRELKLAHEDTSFDDGIGIDFNRRVIDRAEVSTPLHKALEMLSTVAQDHGDHFIFDNFAHKNTGTDKKGNLVLVDPMFDSEMLREDSIRRRRKF